MPQKVSIWIEFIYFTRPYTDYSRVNSNELLLAQFAHKLLLSWHITLSFLCVFMWSTFTASLPELFSTQWHCQSAHKESYVDRKLSYIEYFDYYHNNISKTNMPYERQLFCIRCKVWMKITWFARVFANITNLAEYIWYFDFWWPLSFVWSSQTEFSGMNFKKPLGVLESHTAQRCSDRFAACGPYMTNQPNGLIFLALRYFSLQMIPV